MKKIIFLCLLLLSHTALAFETIRINDKILSIGDSRERVEEVAGKPHGTAQIFNRFGAETGVRYVYYYPGGKTVYFDIKAEEITRIVEEY